MEKNENFENNGKRNEAKEKAKKVTKAIFKRIYLKGIVLIAIIIGVMVLLSGAGWFVFDDLGTWDDDEEGRPSLYTKNVSMNATDGIVVDRDKLIKQALLDAGYTEEEIEQLTDEDIIKRFKMSEKLKRTITSLDECTCAEILWCISEEYEKFMDSPEELEYLLNAELVTQYPYIDDLPEDKLNGVIKFYRYSNGEVGTTVSTTPGNTQGEIITEESTGTEEETQQSGIDASKVFYIGDSWMAGLQTWMNNNGAAYGGVKGVVSQSPSSSEFSDSSLKSVIKSDSSAIVIMLGLNGLSETEAMKSRIDFLSSNYPGKPIYVLKVPYVGKGYTRYGGADKFNANVDTFNSTISNYCNTKSNVTFVDTNTGLMNGRYLADEYALDPSTSDGSLHLNDSGYQKWYYNIQQALKTTGQSGTNNSQGVITNTSNAEVCRLTYVSQEKFNELLNAYNTYGNEQVFRHFTMDDEANVSVATWTKTTGIFTTNNSSKSASEYDSRYGGGNSFTSYVASTVPINYKPMVTQFTLPFNYLWALLVMGEDYDFVEDLADLAYNSIIDIGIYDEVTTTENIDERTYTVTTTTTIVTNNKDGTSNTDYPPASEEYTDTSIITTETDMIKYDVAYADVWIVELGTKYEYSETEQKPAYTNTTKLPGYTNKETIVISASSYKSVTTTVSKVEHTTTQNIYYKNYQKTEPVIREKTDIDENTSDNFVKALRRSVNAYGILTNKGTIEWLCGVLENNEDTVNMVDLTRYLLAKAVDPDAAIEFDFSIFKPDSFSDFGAIYGNSLEEKVWFALKGMGYSDEAAAGAMGNFYCESGFKSNNLENSYEKKLGYTDESYTEAVDNGSYSLQRFISDHDRANCGAGYGLAQWTFYSRKEALYNFAKSKGTSIGDEDMQLEFLLNNIRDTQNTSAHDKWKSSATPEEAATNFCAYYERGTGNSARRSAARMMYEKWKGAEKSSEQAFQVSATDKYMGAVITTDKRVSAIYGNDGYHDHYHRGIDIAAPGGTPIVALGSGKVVDARFNSARGYFVRIDHGNGYCTLYQHCSKIASNISVGTTVKKGQVIAYVGSTGKSSGNHLHLEVWVPHGQGYDNWGNKTWDVTDPSKFNYSLLPD